MTDPSSRYAGPEVATTTVATGTGERRTVRYRRRRFPPSPSELPTLTEHTVAAGDRPDLLAARYLGDPTLFWQICDAQRVVHPDELVAAARLGERLRIPGPRV